MLEAFSTFEFSLKPAMTPLDEVLHQATYLFLAPQKKEGFFFPFTSQTGAGKTHTANSFILEQMVNALEQELKEGVKPRPIYYITNSVDNVRKTYEELLNRIETQRLNGQCRFSQEQAKILSERVLYLPSQDRQLLEMEASTVDRILNAFGLESNPIISRDWKTLNSLRISLKQHPALGLEFQEQVREQASLVYRHIVDQIQARQRSSHPLPLANELLRDLDLLIPGDRLRRGEAHVVFMTTSKFLAGYQTSRYRAKPIRDIHNAILIIDEIDKQNEVILQAMVEQQAKDLIRVIRTLHVNLQQYRLEKSKKYENIEILFEVLKERLNEFSDRWGMQFAFDTDGENLADEPVRIFSDRTTTHVHSTSYILKLTTDKDRQKNIIKSTHSKELLSKSGADQRLSRFVNEADRLYRSFIHVMRRAVWQYLRNISAEDFQKASRSVDGTIQEAVMSLLTHFNLAEFSDDIFAAFDAQLRYSEQSRQGLQNRRMALRSYHDNGFKCVDVGLNEGTSDTVNCMYTSLPLSPTGLLARMVESGAKIIGISATAASPTVIKNFDQEYLKRRLGSQYIELSPQQRRTVYDYYSRRRNYEAAGVSIRVDFVDEQLSIVRDAIAAVTGIHPRKPASVLSTWLSLDTEQDHVIVWVSKLLQAIQQFVDSPHGRYMVALHNRTISKAKFPQFIEFLEKFVDCCGQQAGIPVKLFSGLDAQAMNDGYFEEIQQHLLSTTDKVIVLSAYSSMGEGKNPDYPVSKEEDQRSLRWVGEGGSAPEIRADIDTLYLERPTHQLFSDMENPYKSRLLLFHQIMCLQEAGWISPKDAYDWVSNALRGSYPQRDLQRYHKTGDYPWAVRKVIEQAVGRMARTAFKRPEIRLLIDAELVPILSDDHRPRDLLSHEYYELVQQASMRSSQSIADDKKVLRRINLARRNHGDTLNLIRDLLQGLHGDQPQKSIEDWELLRQQLLRHPTLDESPRDCSRVYLESPEPACYRYKNPVSAGDDTGDSEGHWRDCQFFEEAVNGSWVSEAESRLPILMRNPIVRAHFEAKGYATEWRPNRFIMTPAAFTNIYKGALGEEGISALLLDKGLFLQAMPAHLYERFDFILGATGETGKICVDAKHWRFSGEIDNHKEKASEIENQLGIRHFAYINLFGDETLGCRFLDNNFVEVPSHLATVIEVPGLVDSTTGNTINKNIETLITWMGALE